MRGWESIRHFRALAATVLVFLLCAVALADNGELLEDGSEALGARLRVIRSAKHELMLSTFVVKCDESSAAIHSELIAAAKRGVDVKYLVDAFTLRHPGVKSALAYLQASGVKVKIYNPLGMNAFAYYFRMHDKIVLADGDYALLGGRNHWNESFSHGRRPHFDLEVLLKGGETAVMARAYFLERWGSGWSWRYFTEPPTAHQREQAIAHLARADDLFQVKGFDPAAFQRGLEGGTAAPIRAAEFVFDRRSISKYRLGPIDALEEAMNAVREEIWGSAPRKSRNSIDTIEAMIDSARKKIVIETPWFVTTNRVRRALKRAKARGVEIVVLTNSAEGGEVAFRNQVSRVSSRKFFQRKGIPLFEFHGPASLHSKYISVDGELAYVGSFNFGPRSEHFNSETGVIVRDRAFVAKVDALFQKRIAVSRLSPPYHPIWDSGCIRWFTSLLSTQY